jgi:hypothetical protein
MSVVTLNGRDSVLTLISSAHSTAVSQVVTASRAKQYDTQQQNNLHGGNAGVLGGDGAGVAGTIS